MTVRGRLGECNEGVELGGITSVRYFKFSATFDHSSSSSPYFIVYKNSSFSFCGFRETTDWRSLIFFGKGVLDSEILDDKL